MRDVCDICGKFVDFIEGEDSIECICSDCKKELYSNDISDESTFDEDYWWNQ